MSDKVNFKSQLIFKKNLGQIPRFKPQDFLIYDRTLEKHNKGFIKKFSAKLALPGGEDTKTLSNLPKLLEKILNQWPLLNRKDSQLVILGGGSLGDFGGFCASIIKRGIGLVHIPSTWLAALDSAHGGKNALNVGRVKNQVGTFYPADKVIMVKDLLLDNPQKLHQQALGEFVKMALLSKGNEFEKLTSSSKPLPERYWSLLKPLVNQKYKIVLSDPFERRGRRQFLNLGHTLGHILESHYGRSHGESVMQGLLFSLELSRDKKIMSANTYEKIQNSLSKGFSTKPWAQNTSFKPMTKQQFLRKLLADKKRVSDSQIQFVFLKNIGQPVLKKISAKQLLTAAQSQGWVR